MGQDIMSALQVTEEWLDWESTGAKLTLGDASETLRIRGISLEARDAALGIVRDQLALGSNLMDALKEAITLGASEELPVGSLMSNDVILVDASHVTQASPAVDITKSVSALARGTRRVVAVAGTLDFSGESDYDNLSAFGALMVRLNVTQVFAVGRGARALFLSVGMEGSWDGESRFCEDSDSAYDDIRAHIRPGDVVLVLGSTDEPLSEMVEKLKADLS